MMDVKTQVLVRCMLAWLKREVIHNSWDGQDVVFQFIQETLQSQ